jgi:NAD(P)-dependent dehydrogenase (short-subunit alcohol dehydrogenase family)
LSTSELKVAVVTGAGGGIGKDATRALVGAGFEVVMTGRNGDKLRRAANDVDSAGLHTHCFAADLGEPGRVEDLFRFVDQRFGRIDLLFNNAGIFTKPKPIEEISFTDWSAALASNLTSAFLCTKHAFRLMRRQTPAGGRIINNGSISAHVPRPHAAAYTATKHGITGLTKATALEGRAYSITCCQLDIGNAATDMTQEMNVGMLQADGTTRPEPRMHVRHVSDAIALIASLPLEVNIPSLTIMAAGMPYVGRG